MPFANYKLPEGFVSDEQKQEIIQKTTEMFVGFWGEQCRASTIVLVDEVKDGGWGVAGEVFNKASAGIED
ncbi:tautomerase family protein [Pokkaliibacter sp. CJK22405]|uniref:tautomerase family protein n=1 Tax=Pokkaliibacter sp. CJK22405 TaxID=3384615 RepID=UPI003984D1A2